MTSTAIGDPGPTAGLRLPDQVREDLATAGQRSMPLFVSFTDEHGRNRPSYRGSATLHGTDEIVFWLRTPQGGLARHIAEDGRVVVGYRNPTDDRHYRIEGVARIDTDPGVVEAVWDGLSPMDRGLDPQRAGVPVIVTPVRLAGHTHEGPIEVLQVGEPR